MHEVILKEAKRPFDLAEDPLMRVRVIYLQETELVLQFIFHHIVFDEWSQRIFFSELQANYAAAVDGNAVDLPTLSSQYADFAIWQREMDDKRLLNDHFAYFLDNLKGAPHILDLPVDNPRPAVLSYKGATTFRDLPMELLQRAAFFSQHNRATLFVTLLAAFQVLLSRYAQVTDFLVGTPVTNRRRLEHEGLIGFFLNTLVLRADLSGEPSFDQVVRRTRESVLKALDHQDLPFERLVERLKPERDASRQPLIQVMFVFNPDETSRFDLPGLNVDPLRLDYGSAKFDLSLFFTQDGENLHARLEYNSDIFTPATMERLLDHFQMLLTAALVNPDLPVARLPLTTEADQHRLLIEWTGARIDHPHHLPVHHFIEIQANKSPELVAVVSGDQCVSYGELNRRANQLAQYLHRLGVGLESLVGVCLDRSIDMVVALLGVLKAGGAYVPLDPDYPPQRLSYMIADARVPVLITQQDHLDRLDAGGALVVAMDRDWGEIAREHVSLPSWRVLPEHPAYVIYTSGSTGLPKGAVITHRALSNHMHWMQRLFPLHEDDAVFQKTPFSFDASVWEFFAPLMAGARLVMARPEGHKDIPYLVEAMQQHRITVLQTGPSLLQLLAEFPGFEKCTSLRRIYCGGEALPPDLPGRVLAKVDVELINLYGPTETCIDSIVWVCPRGFAAHTVPIGRPIDNVQAYILDRHLQLLPVGVPGELYIAGLGLGRGYFQRPELTAERFIPNPFAGATNAANGGVGERLYRTGDLARYLPDGNIEFLGRLDFQVKLHGQRVELEEIQQVLVGHPDVLQAIVLVRQDPPGGDRLVAYLVIRPGASVDANELRMYLKTSLPAYMIPVAFVFLDQMPLSPSGKIDRKSLPPPARQITRQVAPRTSTEKLLATLWKEILELDQMGIDDNFFELGGHSLLAVRLISRINSALGIELPLGSLFERATIRDFANYIDVLSVASAEAHSGRGSAETEWVEGLL
jgi:amino acid adenylation domain-containing protein